MATPVAVIAEELCQLLRWASVREAVGGAVLLTIKSDDIHGRVFDDVYRRRIKI